MANFASSVRFQVKTGQESAFLGGQEFGLLSILVAYPTNY